MKTPRKGILVLGTDRDSSRNYMGKVEALASTLPKGQAFEVTVVHDDECPLLNGGGYCACDPEVALGRPEDLRGR